MLDKDALILDALERLEREDFSVLDDLAGKDDPILAQLHTLGLQLQERYAVSSNLEKGIQSILDTMIQIAGGNFDVEVLFDRQDELLDALMVGMNMMAEELSAATNQLEFARDQAIEANTAKSQFLASMSHELRTPLNAIIGYAELIKEDSDFDGLDQIGADADKILTASKHLLGIISDILDLSKIEAGHIELSVEPFSLDRLCEELCSTIRPLASGQQNNFVFEVDAPLGRIASDRMRLNQVLLNLLSNANKFTEEGTVTFRVERDQKNPRRIHFRIKDTGIGISQDRVDAIFEPFVQEDGSTTRRFGGTGLGLAISQRLTRMLGGEITVESVQGEGSTFTATIIADIVDDEHLPSEEAGGQAGAKNTTKQISIVAIDDDPNVLDLLQRHMRQENVRLTCYERGGDFFKDIEVLPELPDLILLDIELPDVDGWTILAKLQKSEHLREIPVIVISVTDNKLLGFTLGASDYIIKPINFTALWPTLIKHLNTNHEDLNILLVDDDPEVHQLAKRSLEPAGYVVTSASNGSEALGLLESSEPNLIVLDLMMPEMDGFEFYEHLQAHNSWSSIPVVVLSAMQLSTEQRKRLSSLEILEKDGTSYTQLDHVIARTLMIEHNDATI